MNTAAVLFLCVTLFSVSQSLNKEEKEAFHKACVAESGVSEEIVAKAKNGDFIDDPKFKAHLLCFGKKAGFHNEAGEIQKDVIKTKLSSVVDKMAECAVQKDTPEDTAFEAFKCMYAIKSKFL